MNLRKICIKRDSSAETAERKFLRFQWNNYEMILLKFIDAQFISKLHIKHRIKNFHKKNEKLQREIWWEKTLNLSKIRIGMDT